MQLIPSLRRDWNKYLRCANCVNIAAWECASHCALEVKESQLISKGKNRQINMNAEGLFFECIYGGACALM